MKINIGDSVYCSKDRALGIVVEVDSKTTLHFNITIQWADRDCLAYNNNSMAAKYRRAYLKLRKSLSL